MNQLNAVYCGTCGASLPMTPPVAQPYAAVAALDYAGFWRRFVALLIDGIVLGIGWYVLRFVSWIEGDALGYVLRFALTWLYHAGLESSAHQASLGKMLLGIRVTDESGRRVSFARASGRHLAKVLSALILLIGYVMAAFTARKQALHDLIAGCLVVRR